MRVVLRALSSSVGRLRATIPDDVKKALESVANSVFVLGVRHGNHVHGATMAWVSQASYTEPYMCFALDKTADTHRALEEGDGTFGLTLLRSDQQALADHFGQDAGKRQATVPDFQDRGGAPALDRAAWFAGEVVSRADAHTHTVIVGRITAAGRSEGEPLLFSWDKGYTS